jgi:hypothetical protein
MDVEGVPLRTSLRLLLKQIGLGFSLRKGMLYITSENQGAMMGGGMGMMGGGGMMGRMMGMRGGMMGGGMSMMGTGIEDSSPGTKAVLSRLDQPIPMMFPEPTPLERVLDFIKKHTTGKNDSGMPIYVERSGLREVGRSLTSPVTIDLENIPLKDTLELLLDQLDLDYCVKDGLLFISTKSSVANERAQLIGASTDDSVESRGIASKFNEPIAMKFPDKTMLKDVQSHLAKALKGQKSTPLKVSLDLKDLQKRENAGVVTVSMDVEGVPLRTTLRLLLKQAGLIYSLEKGILHIRDENQMGAMGGMMGGMMGGAAPNQPRGSSSMGGMMSGFWGDTRKKGSDKGDQGKRKRGSAKASQPR